MSAGLRVGLVCPYSLARPGGVQNQVLGLAGELLRLGHQPRVIAPGRLGPAADPQLRGIVSSAGPGVPVPYNGSVARLAMGPRVATRLRRWLDAGDFDLLHIHEPLVPSLSLLALRTSPAPVVATFHAATRPNTPLRVAARALAPVLDRIAIDRIDVGIAVSACAREVVRSQLGLNPRVISNSLDARAFGGPRTSGRSPRITLLGRLDEPRKGLSVFLQALPLVRRARPDVEVVLAGPIRGRLPDGVRRIGWISDAERADLLRSTDVFVAPNTGRESFGLIVVEALAAGARVVTSALPAFIDVLTGPDGRTHGRTFPPGDHRALAAQVLRALDEPPAPAAARAHSRRYDWSVTTPLAVDAYRDARTDSAARAALRLRSG